MHPITPERVQPVAPRPGLRATNVTKRFGHAVALSGVNFEVRYGEIMGLVGPNGAGKSTLMKILSGFESADEGQVVIDSPPGSDVPGGVAVAHQELSLVPGLSVAENLFLGDPRQRLFRSRRHLARQAAPHLQVLGLDEVDPLQTVASLSVGQRYLLELARMLAREAKVLFVDEPTAALSETEALGVLRVLRRLAESGCAVVLVTHRLDEIMDFADRVTVIRDGAHHGPLLVADCTLDSIVALMLGDRLDALFPPTRTRAEAPVTMELQEVMSPALTAALSLALRQGEILGFAGQVGSGALDLLEALAGRRPLTRGTVTFGGVPVNLNGRPSAVRHGIGYCSAERKTDGLFPMRRVLENFTAPALSTGRQRVGTRAERVQAYDLARTWRLPKNRVHSLVEELSGGNQQKVVLGKWTSRPLRALLLNEPTRGIDVGSRAEIYLHLRQLADEGLTVVFASSEVDEVLGLADRIVTFCAGRPVRVESSEHLTAADIAGDIMSG
jgi:ribose transport system ATP-binding protein/rhamnose transport system ATP-binding protein